MQRGDDGEVRNRGGCGYEDGGAHRCSPDREQHRGRLSTRTGYGGRVPAPGRQASARALGRAADRGRSAGLMNKEAPLFW